MKKFLIAFFIILIVLVPSSAPDLLTPYLRENRFPLDINALDISPMAEDLDQSEVILSGALWHGTTASYDLHYAMTVALHQQAGIKYLLLGISHSYAQLYNAYLQSGDEEILYQVHEFLKYTSSSNHEHLASWQKLYQYNSTLPQEDKITVVGIDIEEQPYAALYYLSTLPGSKHLSLPVYSNYPLHTPQGLAEYVKSLQQNVSANETYYREAMGDSFSELEIVVNNLANTVKANLAEDYFATREQMMYENFLRAYAGNPPGKYFGQWTIDHIYQRASSTPTLGEVDKFAMYLNHEDSPVQGKVLSISAIFADSSFRLFYGRRYHFDTYTYHIGDVKPFTDLAASDFTLFRLKGEDSPFELRPYTVLNNTGGAATDYYQYMLVIKNSEPCGPNKR